MGAIPPVPLPRVVVITEVIEIVAVVTEVLIGVAIYGNVGILGAMEVLAEDGVTEITGLAVQAVIEVKFSKKNVHPQKSRWPILTGGSGGGRGDYGNGQWESSSWAGNQSSGAGWSGGSPGYGSGSGSLLTFFHRHVCNN